jgi:hypothetical protein
MNADCTPAASSRALRGLGERKKKPGKTRAFFITRSRD